MSYDDGLFFERMVAEYTRSPGMICFGPHQFRAKTITAARAAILRVIQERNNGFAEIADRGVRRNQRGGRGSDRNVWVLAGEILEELLDKTGVAKDEIDGLVMAGLTGTGAANPFWAQTTADVLGLEVGFCEQVHTGGCSAAGCVARAAAAIDYGMCDVAFLLFADTHVLEDRTDHSHSYRREWTDLYGLDGSAWRFRLLSRAYEAK